LSALDKRPLGSAVYHATAPFANIALRQRTPPKPISPHHYSEYRPDNILAICLRRKFAIDI